MSQSLQALQQCINDTYIRIRESEQGLFILEIDTAHCSASMALQGAHVMTWQPKGEEPVLWLSADAKLEKGKSIRGGIPICWPWFGEHETEPTYAAHGFARTAAWELVNTAQRPDGAVEVVMRLSNTRTKQWDYDTPVEIKVVFGRSLNIELTTHNQSPVPVRISEALHTYFYVKDVRNVEVQGLDGCTYLDKLEAYHRKQQQGAVCFAGEVDRIYIDQSNEVVIQDKALQRSIRISKKGSQSSIVWNPWLDKCVAMGDLGADAAYLNMLCVESGNAADNTVTLAAGDTHTLSVTYHIS